jgi:hypothetical protein
MPALRNKTLSPICLTLFRQTLTFRFAVQR